jgi:hypothetical protein
MKIGFLGPSTGMTPEQIVTTNNMLQKFQPNCIVCGNNRGAEYEFISIARKGLPSCKISLITNMSIVQKNKKLMEDSDMIMVAVETDKPNQRFLTHTWTFALNGLSNNTNVMILYPNNVG